MNVVYWKCSIMFSIYMCICGVWFMVLTIYIYKLHSNIRNNNNTLQYSNNNNYSNNEIREFAKCSIVITCMCMYMRAYYLLTTVLLRSLIVIILSRQESQQCTYQFGIQTNEETRPQINRCLCCLYKYTC